MGKLNVKNGTPLGNAHLCRGCQWGQVMTGYRESDLMVICTNTNPNIVVPFTLLECTEFDDKYKPNWEQMKNLAIEIQPVRVSAKTAGFCAARPRPTVARPDDEDEAGLAR